MLPAHHVARPRLAARLVDAPRAFVLAPGGWGKSSLLREVGAARAGRPTAVAELFHEPSDLATVARELARALRAVGQSDLARRAVNIVGDDVDAARASAADLCDLLAEVSDAPAIVVDDVHRCDEAAAAFLASLARQALVPVLLAGRTAPGDLAGLVERGALVVDASALALRDEEAEEIWARLGRGPVTSHDLADAVDHWPGAFVLAARQLAGRGPEDATTLLGSVRRGGAVLRPLVADRLAALSPDDARAVRRAAALPRVDESVLTAVGGPGVLERTLRAGLPWLQGADGWLRLADPFREAVTPEPDPAAARAAAAAYRHTDRDVTGAVDVLLRTGLVEEAADALVTDLGGDPTQIRDEVTTSVIARLDERALAAHADVGLLHARALEQAVRYEERAAFLDRLAAALVEHPGPDTPAARRAVEAEQLFDRTQVVEDAEIGLDHLRDLEGRLRTAVAACPRDEPVARARLLEALGKVLSRREEDRPEAEAALREAVSLLVSAGENTAAVRILQTLSYHVHVTRGEFRRGDAALVEATRLVGHTSVVRGRLQCFRVESLVAMGDVAAARAALEDARELFVISGTPRMLAVHAWYSMAVDGADSNREAAIDHLERVEASPIISSFLATTFRADAVPVLARLGATERARRVLEPALSRRDDYFCGVGIAELAVLARTDDVDPDHVGRLAAQLLAHHALEPRERWRVHAYAGYAHLRAGENATALSHAQRMEACCHFGGNDLAGRLEPELSTSLRRLLGTPAADEQPSGPVLVRVLGSPEVHVGGTRVQVTSAPARALVCALACHAGTLTVDAAVELLWPGADPELGRRRLRNVLARLRSALGSDAVTRSGERISFTPDVVVDVQRLLADADAAEGAAAAGEPTRALSHARDAVAWWRGMLLPHESGEDVERARAQSRRAVLSALHLLASAATDNGDVDEAVRWLERGALVDPLDEQWWLRAHALLLAAGRVTAARRAADNAADAMTEAGLRLSPAVVAALRASAPDA